MYANNREVKANKFCKTVREFGEQTSFHGVQYIVTRDNTIFEKILWSAIVIIGIIGSCYMTNVLWERFASNPIRVSIQSIEKPTTNIPFPAVTICPVVRQAPAKVKILLNKLVLPNNITKQDVKDALPSLLAYTLPVRFNQADIELLDLVFRFNKYSIQKLFAEIEPSCDDMLLKCKWEKDTMPCDHLFNVSLTKYGHCCSFNFGRKGKRRTVYFGVQLGLSVIMDPITSNPSESVTILSSSGAKILVHAPQDYPGLYSAEKILANGSESLVRISASRIISSRSIKSLTMEQRKCIFSSEKKLKYFSKYRYTNCEVECRLNRIYHLCKCIPYRFGLNVNKPICNISDIPCLNKYFEQPTNITYTSVLECDCPSRCNDYAYRIETSSVPLSRPHYVVSRFYETDLGDEFFKKMVVHVYFGSQFQQVNLRDTVTSIYNLFSSLGGVFGLFLGSSFLSVLEVLYFFCIRLFREQKFS